MKKCEIIYIYSDKGSLKLVKSSFLSKKATLKPILLSELETAITEIDFSSKSIVTIVNSDCLEHFTNNDKLFATFESNFFINVISNLSDAQNQIIPKFSQNHNFLTLIDFVNFPVVASNTLNNLIEKIVQQNINHHFDKFKFESIGKNNRDAIFFTNYNLEVIDWTKSAEKTFGYSKVEAIGQNFTDLIIQKDQVKDFVVEFGKLRKVNDSNILDHILELYCKTKNSKYFPVEIIISKCEFPNEKLLTFVCRDVTTILNNQEELTKIIEELQVINDFTEQNSRDLVELNAKLGENEIALQSLNADKDRFFSIIAHDLKGPFQALLGYSELLANAEMGLTQEEIIEFASSLNESAKNLFKLLENLLEWSRLQRGQFQIQASNFDFKELADTNLELIKHRAQQKNVLLENKVNADTLVYADRYSVDTVLRNLLSNAIKFTKEGETIGIKVGEVNGFLEISVYDTGVGISKEVQAKLFRIDTKHTTAGTADEQGTGLGLILCKDMVEKNGGTIRVESEIGKGSQFKFTVPIGMN